MLFGGTFDPAYVMSIFALPSQMQPITNKRNAGLTSKHMEEALGVPPRRGFIRFVPVREENMAYNGRTLAGELDEIGRNFSNVPEDNMPAVARRETARKRLRVKVSLPSYTSDYDYSTNRHRSPSRR
jgi:hypothetical protein